MDRIEIDGTPYVAPFKSRLAKTDEVYVTDADGRRLAVLNTYTQRPSSDVEGREQEKNEAINIGKFMVDALNEKAQRPSLVFAPSAGWADRYTSVTIKVLGRMTDLEAFAEFCEAVDADLGRDPGTTLAASVPAYLEGGPSFRIDATAVDYGYVERAKAAAIKHEIDIIVTCGPAEEHLGSIYTVSGGQVSETLPYDAAHDMSLPQIRADRTAWLLKQLGIH